MEVEPTLLAEPDSTEADSLVSSLNPDDLANEQTWPTEEEMQGGPSDISQPKLPDAKKGTTPKIVKRIPKGMSEYQAAWIIDEDEDEGGENDSDGGEDGDGDEVNMEDVDGEEEEEEEMQDMPMDDHEMDTESRRTVAFEDLDMEEENKQSVPFPNFIMPLNSSANLNCTKARIVEEPRERGAERPHLPRRNRYPKRDPCSDSFPAFPWDEIIPHKSLGSVRESTQRLCSDIPV